MTKALKKSNGSVVDCPLCVWKGVEGSAGVGAKEEFPGEECELMVPSQPYD